jgi:serine/threonine protein kinase
MSYTPTKRPRNESPNDDLKQKLENIGINILQNDGLLLDLLKDYCIKLNSKSSNLSKINSCNGILDDINSYIYSHINYTENNKTNIEKFFDKFSNNKCSILIEGIIYKIIHSIPTSYTVNSTIKVFENKNNKNIPKKLKIRMKRFTGITFGEWIIELFRDESKNKNEKKDIFKAILERIKQKLKNLQDILSFIHGDLNSGNIMIGDDGDEIIFIDFEHSRIKIPETDYFLCNVRNRKTLSILSNDERYLENFDLAYLINDLKSFEYNESNESNKNMLTLNGFFEVLRSINNSTIIDSTIFRNMSIDELLKKKLTAILI